MHIRTALKREQRKIESEISKLEKQMSVLTAAAAAFGPLILVRKPGGNG